MPPLGWVRPLQVGASLMGGLFMAVGAGTWALFWFADAEPPTGMRKWGSALFALLFFLVGLRFALESVRSPRWWALRRFRGGSEPWGEGYRWSRVMRPLAATGEGWIKGCVGLLALIAFAAVINLVWLDLGALRGSKLLAFILIPLFTLLILFILGSAAWQAVKRLRLGSARLHLLDYPASPGGTLRAEFESGGKLEGKGVATATLSCVEQEPPGDAAERGTATAPAREIAYSQKRRIEVTENLAGPRRLRLEFELPEDVPVTELQRPDGGRRYWVLEVSLPARSARREKGFTFLVPIYRS